MTTDETADGTVAEVSVRTDDSDEWERTAIATARVTGTDGPRRVWRRYEALPRHNDVVAPDAIDVEDGLVERPDEVHVHTKWYETDEPPEDDGDENRAASPPTSGDESDESDEYLRDAHETWRPEDPTVLGDPDAFRAAVRDHALATLGATADPTDPEPTEE